LPHIYDNKSELLGPALNAALEQAVAFDTCIGYLNLRGWQLLANAVDGLVGVAGRAAARVLIGMAARPDQLVRDRCGPGRPPRSGLGRRGDHLRLRQPPQVHQRDAPRRPADTRRQRRREGGVPLDR
jgi:hypothetical protein